MPETRDGGDQDLMVRLARGDRDALTELCDRHGAVMLALGKRLLGDSGQAEQVLHDVFVEVWQYAGDYDPEHSTARGWLLLRLRTRCLDQLRQRAAEAVAVSSPSAAAVEAETAKGLAAWEPLSITTDVSAEQWRVLELRYLLGLPVCEVAHTLGLAVEDVDALVVAALDRLRPQGVKATIEGVKP